MPEHAIVFAVLAASLVLFVLERWRYDVVALLALLTLTLLGIVPTEEAFAGFGHPAVVTVAAILVISRALGDSGLVDWLAALLTRIGGGVTTQVAALTAIVAACSAFMNNVGALALLMPVAIRTARRTEISPSLLLMPLAFGSLLGGMTTLIGTPPNIIIGSFRQRTGAPPFQMFDFAPAGVACAVGGVAFIALLGWRLIPVRKARADSTALAISAYLTELEVPEASPVIGTRLSELTESADIDFVVAGLVRGGMRRLAPAGTWRLQEGDVLLVKVDPKSIEALSEATGLKLAAGDGLDREMLQSDEITLFEAMVLPQSLMVGRSPERLRLRDRHGLNLLAVARQGARLGSSTRLKEIRFLPGDVLLAQGASHAYQETLSALGCLPLAERELRLGSGRGLLLTLGLFAAAIGAIVSGLMAAPLAFTTAAIGMVLTGSINLRDAYRSIEWPVIVLLGAMIPVGGALEASGGAELVASSLGRYADTLSPAILVGAVLVLSMVLSDVMNNAATAVLMAPIAISVASGLGVSSDPFLMAVAIGASCAFLTPVGHQSNTLVMGPGGYRFRDYWRLGLPLEMLILATALPVILWVWPLDGGG